jgi:hypothetical protein
LSSSEALHTVTIATDPEALVVIFDGYDCVKTRGTGTATWQLPAGFYTVRAQLAGQQVQKRIIVPDVTSITLLPQIYSPTPIAGAATTHEYYHDPAQQWSNTSTLPAATPREGWIFVFVRLSSENSPHDGDIARGISILDVNGGVVFDLSKREITQRNDFTGWVLVSAPIDPGFYRIRYDGAETREAALYVYKGFSTQIFITYFEWPRLEQMRVFLRPLGLPFVASDFETRSIELALLGLQNGIASLSQTLPRQDQRALLDGKFTNPMLGLIGAHWLLQDKEATSPFVTIVMSNLRNLLGSVPDVIALETAAALRFKMPLPPATSILTPPFIRQALEILVKERPELFPEGQFTESVLQNLYLDSPWTSWHVEPLAKPGLKHVSGVHLQQETSLDWMESAVLDAGLSGEFDVKRIDDIAKQLVVTPALLRDANKRLNENIKNVSIEGRFNDEYLAEGQDARAEIRIENWATRAAAFYNQPLPLAFKNATAYLSAAKDIRFQGPAGDVEIKFQDRETQLVIGNWKSSLEELNRSFPDLSASKPKSVEGNPSSFMLSARYGSDTPRGSVALASAGPPAPPRFRQFNVLSTTTRWQGLRDSLQAFLRSFGLPRQVAKASDLSHETLHFGHVDGSLRFRFDTEVAFRVLEQAEDDDRWHSAEVPQPLSASGTLTASGAFQFGLFRDPKGTTRFSIHRAARSAFVPIYLAEFEIASFQWYAWLRQASVRTRQLSEPIARTFLAMAQTFTDRVKDRAFYHWLDNRGNQDESWYGAEMTEAQSVSSAITRVLGRQNIAALRSALEQTSSETPLIEIQIEGNDGLDVLEQAMDGSFDLRYPKQGVTVSGALVSLAGQRHNCELLVGTGRPTVLVDDADRVVAVDTTYDSPAMGMARMQAAASSSSGPAVLSAPSAELTSFFSGATSDLLELLLTNLVKRWFPKEGKGWHSVVENVGIQAGAQQWSAILQLKLGWAIDIRKAGGDAALASELIDSTLRRECRLLLPFLLFDDVKTFLNLKKTIPLLVYHLLPPEASSWSELKMNSDLSANLLHFIIPLRRALKNVQLETSDETWSLPYWFAEASSSWPLKLLLSWEEHVIQVVTPELSNLQRNPSGRFAYLDRLAVELVDALEGLPMLSDKPRAINALRIFLFTTALSLMATDPANVSAEFSVTALDSQTTPAPEWIDSPESIPLNAIVAHGRLSAMALSWSPVALRARRAVSA